MYNKDWEIPNRILYLREKLGLTQSEFGRRICMTAKQVSRLECGKNKLTLKNAKIICYEFDVNMEWLCYNKGKVFTDYKTKEILEIYKNLSPEMRRCAEVLLAALAQNEKIIIQKDYNNECE